MTCLVTLLLLQSLHVTITFLLLHYIIMYIVGPGYIVCGSLSVTDTCREDRGCFTISELSSTSVTSVSGEYSDTG